MYLVIAWWDLTESPQTVETMRHYLLDESVEAFSQVEGLRLKTWVADDERNRWGTVMLWESRAAFEAPLPSAAATLIGFPPTEFLTFEVEATIEGLFTEALLSRRGRAFAVDAA